MKLTASVIYIDADITFRRKIIVVLYSYVRSVRKLLLHLNIINVSGNVLL